MNIQGIAQPLPWRPQSAPPQGTPRPQGPATSAKFDPSSRGADHTVASRVGETTNSAGAGPHRAENRKDGFFRIGHHSQVFAEVEKFWAEGAAKEKEFAAQGLDETDKVVRDYRQARMEKLFGLQTKVMNSALHIEMASKMVEHATTGTRTLLQTQA